MNRPIKRGCMEVYNDYGVDRPEFYADLAKAFLFDKDGPAPSEKLAEYYHEVVE